MGLEYVVGLVLARAAPRLSRLRAARARAVLEERHDRQRLDPDPLLLRRDRPRAPGPSAPSCTGCSRASGHFLSRPPRAGWSGSSTARPAWTAASRPGSVYSVALLAFSLFTLLVTYAIQRLQHVLPFNPQELGGGRAGLAFNTAASFTTNTNWQGYARRVDHELPHPDGGPGLAQLHLGRRRHRRRARAGARPHPHGDGPTAPRTLGNFWVDLIARDRLRAAAALLRRRAGASSRRA